MSKQSSNATFSTAIQTMISMSPPLKRHRSRFPLFDSAQRASFSNSSKTFAAASATNTSYSGYPDVEQDTLADLSTCENPEDVVAIETVVGKGSFGKVYKGRIRRTNKVCAIKQVSLEDEDDIDEIALEVNFLSSLRCPYITEYYGSVVDNRDATLWIIMEYCGGGSCADILKVDDFREDQIAVVMRDTLRGLEYLHSQRKIHRDIKAANILLTTEGDVKLADFGVSGEMSLSVKKMQSFVGTPYWMAPEVICKSGYDYKADIWSLAITAIELTDGSPPLSSMSPMKALAVIPDSEQPRLGPGVYSDAFRDFVAACLNKDPSLRPTARELMSFKFVRTTRRPSILIPLINQTRKFVRKVRPAQRRVLNAPPYSEEQTAWDFSDTTSPSPMVSAVSGSTFATACTDVDDSEEDMIEYKGLGQGLGHDVRLVHGVSGSSSASPVHRASAMTRIETRPDEQYPAAGVSTVMRTPSALSGATTSAETPSRGFPGAPHPTPRLPSAQLPQRQLAHHYPDQFRAQLLSQLLSIEQEFPGMSEELLVEVCNSSPSRGPYSAISPPPSGSSSPGRAGYNVGNRPYGQFNQSGLISPCPRSPLMPSSPFPRSTSPLKRTHSAYVRPSAGCPPSPGREHCLREVDGREGYYPVTPPPGPRCQPSRIDAKW